MSFRDYETLQKLGEGSFGQVFKVRRILDKGIYVMKQINTAKMSQKLKREAQNEVEILSKIDNCYIVKYFDSFIDKNYLCIIMEFCELGDLHKALKGQFGRPLSENMLLGLLHLHQQKILHRDLKTLNVFLTKDNQVRIGDLGVAKVLSDQNNFARTMVGTPYYISPEMCEEKPYNEKSDIWALGCILYEMCTFKHPFEAANQGALYLKIIRGKYEPVRTYSESLTNLIDRCLQRDYRARSTAQELLQLANVKQMAASLRITLQYQPHPLTNTFKRSPVKQENKDKDILKHQSQAVQKPNIQSKPITRQSAPLSKLLGAEQQPEPRYPQLEVLGKQAPEQIIQIKSSAFQLIKPAFKQPEIKQDVKVQEQKLEIKIEPKYEVAKKEKPEHKLEPKSEQIKQEPKQKIISKDSPFIAKIKDSPVLFKQQQPKYILEPKEKPKQIKPAGQNIFRTPQVNKQKLVNVSSVQEMPDQKKRVRKGAPTELSRQAQLAGQKRVEIQSSSNGEIQDKLKIIKYKNQLKNQSESIQKQDFYDVENLPEKVIPKQRKVNSDEDEDDENNGYQIKESQQKEIVDIEDFFKEHINFLKEEEAKNQQKTVKVQYKQEEQVNDVDELIEEIVENDLNGQDEEEEEYDQDDQMQEDINQQKIPITFVANGQHQAEEGNLIVFEEEDEEEFQQKGFQKDSDQEVCNYFNRSEYCQAYSEKGNEQEEQNENEEQDNENQDYNGEQKEGGEGLNDTMEYDEDDECINLFSQPVSEEEQKYRIQTIKEDPREAIDESTQIDQSLEEKEVENREPIIKVIIDKRLLGLNKCLLENQKRKTELEMIMQAKTRECVRELGQKTFGEVLSFFRSKLNSEKELDEKDQQEIDYVVQNKFVNSRNPQVQQMIIYTIYKILHFEIEILKCQEKIEEVQSELDQ